ncbi:MAG: hypothetical protein HOC71_13080, partial [Candidatus Latescibacteria bacterium]|nr:hypothetical protein [Candidatus Latescibacterota bacterium]
EPIRAYVDMLHGRVEDDNIHMNIWTGPDAEYLTDGILARSDSLWDDAELLVEHMPDVHERVMSARLSVDYALIESDRNRGDAWLVDHEKLLLDVNPAFTELVGRFCKVAGRAGVEKLKEYGYTVEEYNSDIEKQVKPRSLKLLKSRKRKLSSQGLVYRYYEGKWKKLPEFNALKHKKSGSTERFQLPFEGNGEAHGFTFEGFITVPRKGVYAFYSRSDGFSSISIGSQRVVSTNGSDPVRERRGFVALDAGSYPVKATFFTREDGRLLKIYYSGPGIEKQEIPASCFK